MKLNLQKIPSRPGIYRFLDKNGRLLYIGKAKNLKNRVKSYFTKSAELTPAKKQMVGLVNKIEFTVVSNETEALLLESNLIKKYQPPYNIDLKDDKNWLYIIITDSDQPQIMAIRGTSPAFKHKIKKFGPYTSAASVRKTLRLLRKIFPYFSKTGPMVELGKKRESKYHLGRYIEKPQISKAEWQANIKRIAKFLNGQADKITDELKVKMKQAAAKKNYEKAGILRDQLLALEKILVGQKVVLPQKNNEDYLGLCHKGQAAIISLLKIREGKLLDQINFDLKNLKNLTGQEILEQFARRYYGQASDLPQTILSPIKFKSDFKITVPQKGAKQKLLKLAHDNATLYFENNLASFAKVKSQTTERLKQLKNILRLKKVPQRIEAYDISNLQGKQATGSMVVLTDGKIDKKEYRQFKIKTVKGANDPKMMAEVIKRRFNNHWPKPDLLVIDGGPTQLNAAINSLPANLRKLKIISLAKKNEEIYLPSEAVPIQLPKFSPALQLLQLIRDEAHRFAVNYHKKLRKKSLINKK